MFKFLGIFTVIPATVLLAISFFVLLTVYKLKKGGLKVFGQVIAVLLWLAAALVFSVGMYSVLVGRCPMRGQMPHRMGDMMMNQQMMGKPMMEKPMMEKPMMEKQKMMK
ncbi:MAG: hypothetical protein PHS93_01560 [Candidatus Omnitrophica bacterium]|nr:hypothetical protein [Candidatus Omnitrophota bacterium]MDD5351838.1 hypothetical protein [Candidatus Omnitrophota bacterium]